MQAQEQGDVGRYFLLGNRYKAQMARKQIQILPRVSSENRSSLI